jgi:ferritin-like metal-binding protein YciE
MLAIPVGGSKCGLIQQAGVMRNTIHPGAIAQGLRGFTERRDAPRIVEAVRIRAWSTQRSIRPMRRGRPPTNATRNMTNARVTVSPTPQPPEVLIMAKELKMLEELFHDTLKDIYFAEKKILAALPKMAKAAESEELVAAFEKHEEETEGQVQRLEQIFALLDKKPQGKTCDAIMGILAEGQEIMKEYKGSPALDAGLLAAAQAVEHYEITRYGTLKTWAKELGLDEAADLLGETLDQEKKADAMLSKIATTDVNHHAEAA